METRLTPFIVIEGMDGSGKTTLVERLRDTFLKNPGTRIIFTREPGGTPAGEAIRGVLLDRTLSGDANGRTQLLGFFYARSHHLEMIGGKRRMGFTIISDRFDGSTFAYQVHAQTPDDHEREELDDLFWTLRNNIVYGEDAPTLYLYLDLPPETAYARRDADSSQAKNHYDTMPLAFYERQHAGYDDFLSEIKRQGESEVVRIDASQPRDEVFEDAFQAILEHIRSF